MKNYVDLHSRPLYLINGKPSSFDELMSLARKLGMQSGYELAYEAFNYLKKFGYKVEMNKNR